MLPATKACLKFALWLSQGVLQRWLGDYQETAFEYAQQGYAQMQEYIQTNYNDYVEANNLTQVRHSMSYDVACVTTLLPVVYLVC